MRGLLIAAVVASSTHALAEPIRPTCKNVALQVAKRVGANAQAVVARRCERDRWPAGLLACITAGVDTKQCLDGLSRDQRTLLEGDADRLADPRLGQMLQRMALPPPTITLAVLGRARMLQLEGMSAYKAGRFDSAVHKLAAALDAHPTPELVYRTAQAYRMSGDRAHALEHYERYLELAPSGAAANDCRAHVEKLRDVP